MTWPTFFFFFSAIAQTVSPCVQPGIAGPDHQLHQCGESTPGKLVVCKGQCLFTRGKLEVSIMAADALDPCAYRGAIWPSLSPCTVINPILLTYLLVPTGHEQPWFGLCKIGGSWSSTRKDFSQLGHSDAIYTCMYWHKSEATLAQVMACCLMAPSHFLNQCWILIS